MVSKKSPKKSLKSAKRTKKAKTTKKLVMAKRKPTKSKAAALKTKKTPRKASRKKKPEEHFKVLNVINEHLAHLEEQALKAYECMQAIRKRSTPDWKEWVNKLPSQDWRALASAQRDRITLEIRQLSDEILSRIYGAEVLEHRESILKGAKGNLEEILDSVDNSELIGKAVDTAIHTKDGLLAFLNIPTHEEMTQLQRNLNRLERRMKQLKKKHH